ncbi:hypothetical protein GALMADRAFT_916451 [Galerina marginata CBS 339.88]|uniref:Uncharacterized protein n=1 Tax=Galerina marginata (strain CBS 339.88) TaxID=685588 RepID=A0A067SS41_GALM3|nr:hypothetical protein GALMADRAFT_916451 [Galerina marginata CBS 339.88]
MAIMLVLNHSTRFGWGARMSLAHTLTRSDASRPVCLPGVGTPVAGAALLPFLVLSPSVGAGVSRMWSCNFSFSFFLCSYFVMTQTLNAPPLLVRVYSVEHWFLNRLLIAFPFCLSSGAMNAVRQPDRLHISCLRCCCCYFQRSLCEARMRAGAEAAVFFAPTSMPPSLLPPRVSWRCSCSCSCSCSPGRIKTKSAP